MDSRDGILHQRLDHSCAMMEVLENAAEGLDARAVVLEAEVREVEERLLLCEPGDERGAELLHEWEKRWRELARLASAPRPRAHRKRNPQESLRLTNPRRPSDGQRASLLRASQLA